MGDSNAEWGDLASFDQELAESWDSYERLPDSGEHEILDAFVARKGFMIPALVKLGARLSDTNVLAFATGTGIKYRDMLTDNRWSYLGSTWNKLKLVPHGTTPTEWVIVCEGETDGAWLTEHYDIDIAIMPAGAGYFPSEYANQLRSYAGVLVALDRDTGGELGSAKIKQQLAQAIRFPPPEGQVDWAQPGTEPLPLPDELPNLSETLLVSARDLLVMEVPDVASWYEQALLPIGGQLIFHGWIKSFKSFGGMDILSSLAQGQDWCLFEPTEEPCKVAVIQYEITWPYYQERVKLLRKHAREPQLFDENFLTYTPLRRPELVTGNKAQEDKVLKALTDANIQVVMIDPIRRAGGLVDLNAEHEVRKVLGFFERIQDQGITVIATHHDNKDFARRGGGDALGMTGSGAFGGDADSIVSISLPHGDNHTTSPRRNLNFTIRNGPAISGRAMEIRTDGQLVYQVTPWLTDNDYADEQEPKI